MPKIVTDEDREKMRDRIYQCTLNLMQKKGIKKVTVDDITAAVGISKGAFYAYYPSREVCLYKVLNRSKEELFARMEEIMSKDLRGKERIRSFFHDVYLAPDSVVLHHSPAELGILLDKLAPEYHELENERASDYFRRSLELLQITESQMETVALLSDCIGMAAASSSSLYSEEGKNRAIEVLIDSVANYIEDSTTHGSLEQDESNCGEDL